MVTMREVAARAGVSMKTVSNVVNDYPHISAKTRSAVEEAIEALGYRANIAARNLARGRTGLITLAVPHVFNPYFAEVVGHVVDIGHERGLTVLVEHTRGSEKVELDLLSGRGLLTDGLIFSPLGHRWSELADQTPGVPVVLLGERVDELGSADHVAVDNEAAAADAVRHLLELGRTRIAVIGDQRESQGLGPSELRLRGAETALRERGLLLDPELVRPVGVYDSADGAAAMADLLALPEPPDAVFGLSDQLAWGALAALWRRGLRVPDDVAVIGFDDDIQDQSTIPPLTSVSPDKATLARRAIDLLLDRLQPGGTEQPGRREVVPHGIAVRESTVGPA